MKNTDTRTPRSLKKYEKALENHRFYLHATAGGQFCIFFVIFFDAFHFFQTEFIRR